MRRGIIATAVVAVVLPVFSGCRDRDITAPLTGTRPLLAVSAGQMSVDQLIDALFQDAPTRQAEHSLWTVIQSEHPCPGSPVTKTTGSAKSLQSHVSDFSNKAFTQLWAKRLSDPDGSGPLVPVTGVMKLLGMVYSCSGYTPPASQLPPPPAGTDAVFTVTDTASKDTVRVTTSSGDAGVTIPPGTFPTNVLLLMIRQDSGTLNVNTPYPKLGKVFDISIAPQVPFKGLRTAICPDASVEQTVNSRGVIAHQRTPEPDSVEYLEPSVTFLCPENIGMLGPPPDGLLGKGLYYVTKAAHRIFVPKSAYAGHAAIGGMLDALSPAVVIDPFVTTGFFIDSVASVYFNDVTRVNAQLRATSGPVNGKPVPVQMVRMVVRDANGNVEVQDSVKTDAFGRVSFAFRPIPVGQHTATLSFGGGPSPFHAPVWGSASATAGIVIKAIPVTVVEADQSRLYANPNPTLTHTVIDTVRRILTTDQVMFADATIARDTTSVGVYTNANVVYAVSSTPDALSHYAFTYKYGTMTITPRPLTASANKAMRVYGDADPEFTGTTAVVRNNDAITTTYRADATLSSDAGTYTITPKLAGDRLRNYAVTLKTGPLTVAPAPLAVQPADAHRTYGDANNLTGRISGILFNDDVGAVYGSAPATSPIGRYDITVTGLTGAKAGNYAPTLGTGTLTVDPAPLSVAAPNATRSYGDPNQPIAPSTVTGKLDQVFSVSYEIGAEASSPVGEYPIQPIPSGSTLGNYIVTPTSGTLTVTPAPLTVTPDDQTREYGLPNLALTGTLAGVKNSDPLVATYSTTATSASDVGTYDITANVTGPGLALNYDLSKNVGHLHVTQAPLAITPASDTREYGMANAPFHGTVESRNGDTFDVTYRTDATQASHVGTYAIGVEKYAGARMANYLPATVAPATLTITRAPISVTPANAGRVYGEPNPEFTGAVAARNGDVFSVTYSSTATPASDVGAYRIIVATLSGDNLERDYQTPVLGTATLTVDPAPLSVAAPNATRSYGDPNPPIASSTVTGKLGEVFSVSYAIGAAASSPVGAYPIQPIPSGSTLDNYIVTPTSGTLTVTAAPLRVAYRSTSAFYGAAPCAADYTGFKLSDTWASLSGTLSCTFAGPIPPVGTSTATPGGLTATNYDITYVPGTITITYNTAVGHAFLPPLVKKVEKNGAVPVKFALYMADGVTPVPTVSATITVMELPNFSDTFRFDASEGQYVYQLKVPPGTYRITARLDDGSTIKATITVGP